MVFTIPDTGSTKTIEIPVSDVVNNAELQSEIDGKTYYIFECGVAAKEMNNEIIAKVIDGDRESNEYRYTVKGYAEEIMDENNGYSDKAKELVRAMLWYGGRAQLLFADMNGEPETDPTELASYYLLDADGDLYAAPQVDTSVFTGFELTNMKAPSWLTFDSISLFLESETTLRLYFTPTTDDARPSITDGTNTFEPQEKNGCVYYDITGFSAGEVFENRQLSFVGIDGSSFTANIGAYAKWAIDDSGNEKLADVMTALYNYDQMAIAYRESV